MKALGMNYPIEKGQQGYFEQTYDTLLNEKVKLKNLLNTMEGERYMQPNFGLALHKYLFENKTEDLYNKIESEIRKKVSFWLPNIIIDEMNIDSENIDSNIINVVIKFMLKNNPTDFDIVSFKFELRA